MLVISLVAAVVLACIVMKYYTEENGRFAPVTTPRGKEARLVSISLAIVLIGLVGTFISSSQDDPVLFKITIFGTILGVFTALAGAYWQLRKR